MQYYTVHRNKIRPMDFANVYKYRGRCQKQKEISYTLDIFKCYRAQGWNTVQRKPWQQAHIFQRIREPNRAMIFTCSELSQIQGTFNTTVD